jgi:DNA-binding protein HU-beta
MNKNHLIEKVSSEINVSKATAAKMIEAVVTGISVALKKGDHVTLSGFGTFTTYQRCSRKGRNPQTGAVMKIAARRTAKFSAGSELKKALDRK